MPRAGRICAGVKGERCTEIVPAGTPRCPTHAHAYEAERGSSARRGYGHAHRKATAQALDGATHCAECGRPFTASNPATGGHRVAQRYGGTHAHGIAAQCRRCNYGWRKTGT